MKDDLTIWHIHGLELPLDIEDADTVEKWTIVNKVDRRREKNQKRSSN